MSGIVVCKLVLVVQIVASVARGFVLTDKMAIIKISEGADNTGVGADNIGVGATKQDQTLIQTTVRHYARHELCRNFEGKRRLYIAIKARVCDLSLSFIQNFVMDLCRQNNYMLDMFVKELFDIDGNGVISHFEKQK